MSFDELIRTIAENVSRVCYVRLYTEESKIVYALSDEPELVHAHFADKDELHATWNGVIRLLTTMCRPAFIQTGAIVLFQPTFVTALGQHSDERAYFVIVQFPCKHNLALGSFTMAEREKRYLMFCQLLGLDPAMGGPPPVIQ